MMTTHTSMLARLKEATANQHEQIAQNPYSARLFADTASLNDYRAFLKRLYGFYEPVEALLASIDDCWRLDLSIEQRWKTPLLASDLRALGISERALAGLPHCNELPELLTASQVLGCLYVLEGATLGGQLMARRVGERMGLSPYNGCAFFTAYGPRLGFMWKMFGVTVSEYVEQYGHEDEMIAAANDTFVTMTKWLRHE